MGGTRPSGWYLLTAELADQAGQRQEVPNISLRQGAAASE